MTDIYIEIQNEINKMDDFLKKSQGKKDPLQVLCYLLDEKNRRVEALERLLYHAIDDIESYKNQIIALEQELAELRKEQK